MVFKFFGVCLVFGCVVAAPSSPAPGVVPLEKEQPTVIPIISQSEEVESNGTYKFSYETGNGIKREETSYDKVLPKMARSADSGSDEGNDSDEIHVQQGSYSYTAPDGTLISVRYIADENGFQPIGDHIPKALTQTHSATGGSSEKAGRALKATDSAGAESAPALDKKEGAPESKAPLPPASEPASTTAVAESNDASAPTGAAGEATTASASDATAAHASEITTAAASEASTAAASEATTAVANEATTAAASEATTAVASDVTTATASEVSTAEAQEAASSPAVSEATTTESASTTAAA